MLLLLAAALPGLLWDAPPDTAPALREAGIAKVLVPRARLSAWQNLAGISAEPADPQSAVKLKPPGVNYRIDLGSASRSPWLDLNGWQYQRRPQGRFTYEVKGAQAALAAAEAFCYGGNAMVHPDDAGLKPFAQMLEFLRGVDKPDMPALADIGFLDDGSPAAGEVMNLMMRENLLFQIVRQPDPKLKLNVRLGTKDFPLEDAKNPGVMAHAVRARLTDEKRSVRIYGSLVVVVRVTVAPDGLRVHLLNYAGAQRKVDGVRVRVLGHFEKHRLAAAGSPEAELLDFVTEPDATEFTLPELKTYAVIDLSR